MNRPLHVVFGPTAKCALEASFEFDERYKGEVIAFADELSIGPLEDLVTVNGIARRKEWWESIMTKAEAGYRKDFVEQDVKRYDDLRTQAKTHDLCIWLGKDVTSLLGFMRLMNELKNISKEIWMMDYPHEMYKYPVGEGLFLNIDILNPNQIPGLKQYIRKLRKDDREAAIEDWQRNSLNTSRLRVRSVGVVVEHVDENFYDRLLLKNCTQEFQKTAFVIGSSYLDFLETGQYVNDAYLNWRLKELVKSGKLKAEGVLEEIRDNRVRLAK